MAWLRIIIAGLALLPALVITLVAFIFDGYVEDSGSQPSETLGFAIPWGLAAVALAGLVIFSMASAKRRRTLSWWALALALLMTGVLLVVAW